MTVTIQVEEVKDYLCSIKLASDASASSKMTALLYAIDFAKERTGISKMQDSKVDLYFDPENKTSCEEILLTGM